MSSPGVLVRASRKASRKSQMEVSRLSGIDQARVSRAEAGQEATFSTIEKLLAVTHHSLVLIPTRRESVASLAGLMRESLRAGDRPRALRALIQCSDNLRSEHGLIRGALCLAEPELTGFAEWDAALAALVEMWLRDEQLPLPLWVHAPERSLSEKSVLRVDPADPEPTIDDVPQEFLNRGVLVWRETLASV